MSFLSAIRPAALSAIDPLRLLGSGSSAPSPFLPSGGLSLASMGARAIANWGLRPSFTPLPPFIPALARNDVGASMPRPLPTPAGQADPKTLALLAQDVKTPRADTNYEINGWRPVGAAELERMGLTTEMLQPRDNSHYAQVYRKDGQYVVAFRSSDNGGDWKNNAAQARGALPKNYRTALEIGDRLADMGVRNVTFTGHSLGGGLASAASLAHGGRAVTFNAAGLHRDTIEVANRLQRDSGRQTGSDVTAFYVRGEILSYMQDGGDRVAGSLLGGLFGGVVGSLLGSRLDAPEAYGRRIELAPAAPDGAKWHIPDGIESHGIAWVIRSLEAAGY